jgi:peptide chain release factor 1
MFEKFEWILERYEELNMALSQPDTLSDQARYQKLLKEHAGLQPQVDAWRSYQALLQEERQAEDMLPDTELGEIAREELAQIAAQKEAAEKALRLLLLPRDPNADRNVIIEIRGGAGGDEASLFGAVLMRMYMRYAERHAFQTEPLTMNMTELGGVKEAVFSIIGNGAFLRMKYESGVHRVQRIPVTESGGRIHTSTCTVAVLPEAEDVEIDIAPKDLRIDYYRASGAGGQHVNRTDSAVRITHLPTGLVVTCQDEKSQNKNREQAMRVLRTRLYEKMQSEKDMAYASDRKGQVGTGDRSERIRTYNFPQGRVTDHRIGLTLYKIEDIIDGDLDEMIDALLAEEQAKRLKELSL